MTSAKFKELLNLTIKNIFRRRLRSILTILSITIGIAAIISLVLISNGLFNTVEKQFESMGANSIFIIPSSFGTATNGEFEGPPSGGDFGGSSRLGSDATLTTNDVKIVEKIPEVEDVYSWAYKVLKIEYKNQVNFVFILAIDEKQADDLFENLNIKLKEGTSLQDRRGHFAVVGSYFAEKLYDSPVKIGNKILIEDTEFKVVGILDSTGNLQKDSQVYITNTYSSEIFNSSNKVVDQILVKTKSDADVIQVKDKIIKRLEKTHDKDTFIVIATVQILEIIKNVLNSIKVILISIATISVIVGSIGIMNSIYTSVLERTKEIGILKSIGARKEDIYFIFVSESLILSAFGGLVGLGIGIGISKAVEWYAITKGFGILSIEITFGIVVLAMVLALVIGFLAGILPAKRAAKMNTVNALKNIS
jgi:putative ABC transport system permease protein